VVTIAYYISCATFLGWTFLGWACASLLTNKILEMKKILKTSSSHSLAQQECAALRHMRTLAHEESTDEPALQSRHLKLINRVTLFFIISFIIAYIFVFDMLLLLLPVTNIVAIIYV
jgi:hypothetical protein